MKKIIVIGMMVIGIVILGIVNFNLNNKSSNLSETFLANTEALARESSGGFDCLLTKDNCKFTITSTFELQVIRALPGFGSATLGIEIDLSSGTQIYTQPSFFWPWESAVRCGEDITCNAFLQQLGIYN
jgi:hypothetical protein